MDDSAVQKERAQNLWTSFARKVEPVAQGTSIEPVPDFELGQIGGLEGPKEEVQTYACAATDPEVYSRWGTYPPSGLLLIGRAGVGKTLLARALASLTRTSFVSVAVPRLVIEVIHRGGKVGELLQGWSQTLSEMPPLTVLFEELEFSQAQEIGARRQDLPVGPVMDFLLDLIDRTIAEKNVLVVGSTSHPETLRQAFHRPGRFERIVEVTPSFPSDVIAALEIHAAAAEKRAGHALFEPIDWKRVVGQHSAPSTGDWIRVMHAALRRKARCEAAGDEVPPASTADLETEAESFIRASDRLAVPTGNYV
ncbi:MAG: AAA family ATPase [Deltaproteobacteria bacterium]|nr:AAA family ATPase [Deltaproteobacteria bacterium]